MTRITMKSKIGPDGVLRVAVPVGAADADKEVQLTIEPVGARAMTPDEWRALVFSMAGSISDPTFRRHDQGEYEVREPMS